MMFPWGEGLGNTALATLPRPLARVHGMAASNNVFHMEGKDFNYAL